MDAQRLLAAPDKFRGTATASEVAAAVATAATAHGWAATCVPVSDGGEGLLDCFGGANRFTEVAGPLGDPVLAGWRLDGTRAVIEMAAASGLALVAGRNDPLAATTAGTGRLVAAALDAGADEILIGAGGSATTDGGLGAVDVLADRMPIGARITVAVDVTTRFVDAARVFGPQKGADEEQVGALAERLTTLAERYRRRFGVDVTDLAGAGAAGGLAGGLAALGARIRPGFDVVREQAGLDDLVRAADLVVTGEGRFDETSLLGKAPFGIARLAAEAGVPCLIIAGSVAGGVLDGSTSDLPGNAQLVSLTARFGATAARERPLECLVAVVTECLAARWH